jgi:hypothetical protein
VRPGELGGVEAVGEVGAAGVKVTEARQRGEREGGEEWTKK